MNQIEAFIKSGHLDELRDFYSEGTDVNELYAEDKTALMYACEFQKLEIVKYLISIGANPWLKDNKNFDSEGIAFWYGEASMMNYTKNCKLIIKALRNLPKNT